MNATVDRVAKENLTIMKKVSRDSDPTVCSDFDSGLRWYYVYRHTPGDGVNWTEHASLVDAVQAARRSLAVVMAEYRNPTRPKEYLTVKIVRKCKHMERAERVAAAGHRARNAEIAENELWIGG